VKIRTITIPLLGCFIVSTLCCYSIKPVSPDVLSSPRAADIKVRRVVKKLGEVIEFAESNPGRIVQNAIVGEGRITRAMEIVEVARTEIKSKSFHADKNYYTIEVRGGKIYSEVRKIIEQGDNSLLYVIRDVEQPQFSSINILASEVEKVLSKRFDFIKTLLAVVLPCAIIWLGMQQGFYGGMRL
jgi:predicted methyltransferase